MMNRRPFSGSCTTCSFSTTVPRLAVSARTNRRVPDHCHLFLNASDREIEIDSRLLTRRQTDALAAHGPESRQLDLQPVLARRQIGRGIGAIAGGDNHSLKIRPRFGDRNRRARHGGSRLIFHETRDLAPTDLRNGSNAGQKQQTRQQQTRKT
jgi:hypothetical protein